MKKYTVIFMWFFFAIAGFADILQGDSPSTIPANKSGSMPFISDSYDYKTKGFPKVAIVSPNAASLGIYGAIPVGHYTGIPNISVPIYEINLDGKVIPLNLSYHASGIRVSQEASSVGLGWTLNAGGSIVREVRGRDDFSTSTPPRGYYYDTEFAHWDSDNNLDINYAYQDLPQYKAYLDGYDSEPDLFYFNFASYSGTIIFDKLNSPGNSAYEAKGQVLKSNEYWDITLKLPYTLNFVIIDGDGFKYYFSPKESSITYTNNTSDYNPNTPKNHLTNKYSENETTAWYIDSIVSPIGKKISFFYTLETIVTPISVSEDVSYLLDAGIPPIGPPSLLKGVYKYYNYSYSESVQARLTKIVFEGGYVSFSYSDRLDLESLYAEKAKKMDTVVIYNNKHEIVKSASLQYSYLGNTNSSLRCRLMLDAVEINNHTNKPSSYVFSYNRGLLPEKNSPSCDYWGYYNGAIPPDGDTSFKLSPEAYYKKGTIVRHFPGLDKSMNKNYLYYGSLTEIHYPTGGKTTFDFEPHDYNNSIKGITYKKNTLVDFRSLRLEAPEYCVTTNTFNVDTDLMTDLEVRFHPRAPESGYPYPSIYVYIYKIEPNGQRTNVKYYLFETNESSYFNNSGSNIYTDNFLLPKGTYYFDIRNNHQGYDMSTVSVSLMGVVETETNLGNGGGIRVKSITNYTNNDKSIKKVYNYKTADGKSSGILITPPQHNSLYVLTETEVSILPTSVASYSYHYLYLNGYSTPYTPFSRSAQGALVGYSNVEEIIVEKGNESKTIGSTVYKFINKQDDTANLNDRVIKGFPAISYQENGTPLEICYFDESMKLTKRKVFEYSSKQKIHNIKGLRVFRLPMETDGNMVIKYYDLPVERWHLIRTKEYDYTEDIIQPIITVVEYEYNNINLLPNYEKVIDSKNNIIERQIKYPLDFNSPINIEMQNRRMVNMPVEIIESIVTENERKETSRFRCEYLIDPVKTKNLILLGKIETSYIGDLNLRKDIEYERYDGKGNIMHIKTIDGINTVYLWGYNQLYPIAEIKNATYSQVTGFINEPTLHSISCKVVPSVSDMTLINNLRDLIPSALITTYTYDPLIGMTSQTDPNGITTYYEYDGFGRLKHIKDQDGNILQKFDYHYKESAGN